MPQPEQSLLITRLIFCLTLCGEGAKDTVVQLIYTALCEEEARFSTVFNICCAHGQWYFLSGGLAFQICLLFFILLCFVTVATYFQQCKILSLPAMRACRGFPTRMVYLYCTSCLRYTILVGNPQYRVVCLRQK